MDLKHAWATALRACLMKFVRQDVYRRHVSNFGIETNYLHELSERTMHVFQGTSVVVTPSTSLPASGMLLQSARVNTIFTMISRSCCSNALSDPDMSLYSAFVMVATGGLVPGGGRCSGSPFFSGSDGFMQM